MNILFCTAHDKRETQWDLTKRRSSLFLKWVKEYKSGVNYVISKGLHMIKLYGSYRKTMV